MRGGNAHNYYILPESTKAKPEWSIIDTQEYVGLSTNSIIQLIMSQLGKCAVQAVVLLYTRRQRPQLYDRIYFIFQKSPLGLGLGAASCGLNRL